MRITLPTSEDPELPIAPLIDCVFQLLIYFMVTCSLVKSEGDLGIRLPGVVQQSITVDMPDEQIIEVYSSGAVVHNGKQYGRPDSRDLPDLEELLIRYKQSCAGTKNKAMVTIWADNKAKHQRIVDVMSACAAAKIENVTFAGSAE